MSIKRKMKRKNINKNDILITTEETLSEYINIKEISELNDNIPITEFGSSIENNRLILDLSTVYLVYAFCYLPCFKKREILTIIIYEDDDCSLTLNCCRDDDNNNFTSIYFYIEEREDNVASCDSITLDIDTSKFYGLNDFVDIMKLSLKEEEVIEDFGCYSIEKIEIGEN